VPSKLELKPAPPAIDFSRWLWTDWGRPNFLTRMGVPRIVTNVFTYLLGPFIGYLVMERYTSTAEQKGLHDFVHNPWILSGYAVFYAVVVLDPYLRSKHSVSSESASTRFRVSRENSKDIFVRTYWAALILSLLLFMIGCIELWSRHPLVD
jgi:hypothetical protein